MKPEAETTVLSIAELFRRLDPDEAAALRKMLTPGGSGQGGQEAEEEPAPRPSPARRKDSRSRARIPKRQGSSGFLSTAGEKARGSRQSEALLRGGA